MRKILLGLTILFSIGVIAAVTCDIRHYRDGQNDCFQFPGSRGAICYPYSCGCHVQEGKAGCTVECADLSCQ